MADTRVTSLYVSLGDNPADVQVHRWTDGDKEEAVLNVGGRLTLLLTRTSPEVLRALSVAATELADWREQQNQDGAK